MTGHERTVWPLSLAFAVGCGGAASRDTVPRSTDVVADAGERARSPEGYEYVARRPLAIVALAEARGIEPAIARAAVDHLADSVEACVDGERKRGVAPAGAARVIAQIDGEGRVSATSVRLDPGAGSAESAVLCLLAPTRLMTFPAIDAAMRGLAIEALWGPRDP